MVWDGRHCTRCCRPKYESRNDRSWPIASFRGDAKVDRYRGIADHARTCRWLSRSRMTQLGLGKQPPENNFQPPDAECPSRLSRCSHVGFQSIVSTESCRKSQVTLI